MLRLDPRAVLALFAVLLIAAVWGLTLYQLDVDKKVHVDSAQRDARSLVRLFEEHASRTIDATDHVVSYLRQRYNTVGLALNLAQEDREGLNTDHLYNLLTICDEYGNVILSSSPFKPLNVLDRDHISVHRNPGGDRLYVSTPLQGRVSGKWSLQMTKRISYPDGRFKGVVVASMDPQYFTRLYHEVDVGAFGTISLIGADGIIRVRTQGDTDSRSQDISDSPFFKTMIANGSGLTQVASILDGRTRIVAFAKLKGYPLYTVVGIDLEERFAAYHATSLQAVLLASLITAMVVLFTTGLIILVSRLMESQAQAVAVNRAKSRFLANMSHELRTPLNGILGYAEILRDELASPLHRSFAETIHTCGIGLLRLIEAVLELSALESGKTQLVTQTVVLADLLRQITDVHQLPATARQLVLTVHLAPDIPLLLDCDSKKLIRVLDNLLDNAVRFTQRGSITVRVSVTTDQTLFAVCDTGPGISPSLHQHIFEHFSQGDNSATRPNGGAGLGLAITMRIVQLMGGVLTLESTPGAGSTFMFYLPRKYPLS